MKWRRLFSRTASPSPSPSTESPGVDEDPRERACKILLAYHQTTKHGTHRFARGPAELDWDTQPDPFRRWPGSELVALERPGVTDDPRYEQAFVEGALEPRTLDAAFVAQLFFDSLALSAWKRSGESHWSLRVNPSSGNLHPTEAYLLAPAVAGLSATPFVAHYAPREHALEIRARSSDEHWAELARTLPAPCVLVALTSIHWREAWKYGERAYRYCNHDAGHAIAGVTLAAAAMGWKATLLDGLGTAEIAALTGAAHTRAPEAEEPECVLAIHPQGSACRELGLDAAAVARFAELEWRGAPNVLSSDHVDWEVIEIAAHAARKPPQALAPLAFEQRAFDPPWPPVPIGSEAIPFRRIVRQRRSAVAMDGRSGLASDAFFQTLRRTLPGRGELPFSALPWSPRLHLALFVHRVAGLEPGIYLLVRHPSDEAALRTALRAEFAWTRPPSCPPELPLWFLHGADVRSLAAHVSCDQRIAADGCFSLGMIARCASSLAEDGPWMYPRLFWESGVIGQVLYLEAEALGLSATGIGCFYDDAVHGVLGLRGNEWQSLYHFTIGGAVVDPRITAEPAYG